MSVLEINLRTILEEKNNKIIPKNIKKGVTIFGIEGECTSSNFPVQDGLLLCLENNIETANGLVWSDDITNKQITIKNGSVANDNSIVFNGVNTEFDTGVAQQEMVGGYTIVLRINPQDWSNNRGVCGIHTETSNGLVGIAGLQYVDGVIGFAHAGSGGVKISLTPDDLPVNNWSTFIITSDGNNRCVAYINGEIVGTSENHGILRPHGNLIIGKGHTNSNRFFKGSMSHFVLYNRVLTENEVKKVNAYVSGEEENINIATIDFSDGTTSTSLHNRIIKFSTINAEKMTSLDNLFNNMTQLEEIEEIINCENVNSMYLTFNNCTSLKRISLKNLIKVENLSDAFNNCNNLKEVYLSDLNSMTNTGGLFKGKNIYIDKIVMTGLTSLIDSNNMFNGTTIKDVTLTDLNSLEDINGMFAYCYDLETLNFTGLNNLQIINSAFWKCEKLINMPKIDASKFIHVGWAFSGCSSLKDMGGFTNLGKAYTEQKNNNYVYCLYLNECNSLTHESLMNVINGLYDLNLTYNVAGGGKLYSQQLVLGSTNLAKLTANEIAIATKKGWTVS